VEQYNQSLKRAAILVDFERRLRDALKDDDELIADAIAERYTVRYPWLADDFYRKVYLRGRRRALEARVRTYDRLLAGHNPKTVRYLSEGWRHQREEATAELRELEATAALDAPPWAQILARFRAQVQASEARSDEGTRG
jgi:hypothetical protein